MLEAVAQNKTRKVLFDGRGIAGDPTTLERFYYGESTAQAVAKFAACGGFLVPQFAYVLETPLLDPERFGETVAVNRGMNVKTFDNPDDALAWLGITPANSPDDGDDQ